MALSLAVLLLLLISCVNLSILQLARGSARKEEFFTRLALGAPFSRVVQQLIFETLILAISGILIGTLLAYFGLIAIRNLIPPHFVPPEVRFHLDPTVLLTCGTSIVIIGLLAGFVPSLHLRRIVEGIRGSGLGGGKSISKAGRLIRRCFVAGQVAISVTIIMAAGSAIAAFVHLLQLDLGVDTRDIIKFHLDVTHVTDMSWGTRRMYLNRIRDRLTTIPGAEAVTISRVLPPFGDLYGEFALGDFLAGQPLQHAHINFVDQGFLATFRIPLMSGNGISMADVDGAAHVALVSQSFVSRYLNERNPIGSILMIPALSHGYDAIIRPTTPSEVVRVVGVGRCADHWRTGYRLPSGDLSSRDSLWKGCAVDFAARQQ